MNNFCDFVLLYFISYIFVVFCYELKGARRFKLIMIFFYAFFFVNDSFSFINFITQNIMFPDLFIQTLYLVLESALSKMSQYKKIFSPKNEIPAS